MRRNNLITEKHRPSGVSRRIHTRDANGKKQSFDYIPNLPKYNKNLNFRQASKFQRINARPIENPNGEDIDTVLKDGTIERKGLHLPQGYYDVNNVGGSEHWGIDPKTFAKKYEADPEQSGVYKPKGGPMLASNPLKRNVSFQAPWGGRMDMKAGSRIMQDPNNPNDTYGIGGNEFDDTYKFNESKNMKKIIRLTEGDLHNIVKRSVNKILREFGSDGPDFDDSPYDNDELEMPLGSKRFGHVNSINDFDFESNDDFLDFDPDEPFYGDNGDIDLANVRHESRRRNGRRINERRMRGRRY